MAEAESGKAEAEAKAEAAMAEARRATKFFRNAGTDPYLYPDPETRDAGTDVGSVFEETTEEFFEVRSGLEAPGASSRESVLAVAAGVPPRPASPSTPLASVSDGSSSSEDDAIGVFGVRPAVVTGLRAAGRGGSSARAARRSMAAAFDARGGGGGGGGHTTSEGAALRSALAAALAREAKLRDVNRDLKRAALAEAIVGTATGDRRKRYENARVETSSDSLRVAEEALESALAELTGKTDSSP
jgi:hypothetical protein